ncbi:hypothetical protein B0H12DRAFT_1069708 [Mycena haematopus]|nr:hypothetical protein B0H12DRAFT_1069708 [Mycena haematopus]
MKDTKILLTPMVFEHPDWSSACDFFTGRIPKPEAWDPKYRLWNDKCIAVKRVSDEMFVLVGQGQRTGEYTTVTAKQVALYVHHNTELWYNPPKGPHHADPLGYNEFAMHLSAWDGADFYWAHYDEKAALYSYTASSGDGELATWASWLVHPHHIAEYRVPEGKALISLQRTEMIENQWDRNLIKQEEHRRQREAKRNTRERAEPYPARDMRAAILARTTESLGSNFDAPDTSSASSVSAGKRPARRSNSSARGLGRSAPTLSGLVPMERVPSLQGLPPLPPSPTDSVHRASAAPVQPVASTSSHAPTTAPVASGSAHTPVVASTSSSVPTPHAINPADLYDPFNDPLISVNDFQNYLDTLP